MKIRSVRATALRNSAADFMSRPPLPAQAALGGTGPFGTGHGQPPEPEALTVVEIETDDGLAGIGTVGGFAVGSGTIVNQQFAPLLIGEDSRRIEWLWDRCYAALGREGTRGTGVMALSGVDIALWDLLGKSLGKPVVDLIGGRSKSRVPVYMSTMSNRAGLDALVEEAAGYAADGFRAMKYFFRLGPMHGAAGLREEVQTVRRLREAVGPDVQLMVDAHYRWDLPYARQMFDGIAPFDIAWVENPMPLDDLPGYERLARLESIPIAAGESERTRFPFVDLLNAGVFYLQPDINRVGGLTETLRICGLAATHSRAVCPHQGWLHSWHLIMAKSCCPIGEYFPKRDPLPGNALIWAVLDGEPEAHDGAIDVPDTPGFGWAVNRAELDRRAV